MTRLFGLIPKNSNYFITTFTHISSLIHTIIGYNKNMVEFTLFLLLLVGISLLGFGAYFFYKALPAWFGLVGAYIGIGTSQAIFNQETWIGNFFSWIVIIALAVGFGIIVYRDKNHRQYLVGGLVGIVIGLITASLFGSGLFITFILMAIGAISFAYLSKIMFEPILILGSSFAGAALTIDSLFLLTRWPEINRLGGSPLAVLIWGFLTVLGIAWQFGMFNKKNII